MRAGPPVSIINLASYKNQTNFYKVDLVHFAGWRVAVRILARWRCESLEKYSQHEQSQSDSHSQVWATRETKYFVLIFFIPQILPISLQSMHLFLAWNIGSTFLLHNCNKNVVLDGCGLATVMAAMGLSSPPWLRPGMDGSDDIIEQPDCCEASPLWGPAWHKINSLPTSGQLCQLKLRYIRHWSLATSPTSPDKPRQLQLQGNSQTNYLSRKVPAVAPDTSSPWGCSQDQVPVPDLSRYLTGAGNVLSGQPGDTF